MLKRLSFLKKKKSRKTIDSIITLANNEEIIEHGIMDDIPENTSIPPANPSIKGSKKVSVNITLNLNIKESDIDKIISILDSYF